MRKAQKYAVLEKRWDVTSVKDVCCAIWIDTLKNCRSVSPIYFYRENRKLCKGKGDRAEKQGWTMK